LDFGDVIAKRPPLSDFVLSPTRFFKIDEALERKSCPFFEFLASFRSLAVPDRYGIELKLALTLFTDQEEP